MKTKILVVAVISLTAATNPFTSVYALGGCVLIAVLAMRGK